MPTAEAVARYLLHLAAATPEPSLITQMQLHKLLYYAHGWCLATQKRPLFPARFQAWTHGPVEANVYPVFADYEARAIAPHEARDDDGLSKQDRGIIESVWLGYGKFSAWHLREMTHKEPPWKQARRSQPLDVASKAPITDESMRKYFESLQDANCRRFGFSAAELAESLEEIRRGATTELVLPQRGA
jgi:uncharacterized phage-associated protein